MNGSGDLAETLGRLGWHEEGGRKDGRWRVLDRDGNVLATVQCQTVFAVVGTTAKLYVDGQMSRTLVSFKYSQLFQRAFPDASRGWKPNRTSQSGLWYTNTGFPGEFAQYKRKWEYDAPLFDDVQKKKSARAQATAIPLVGEQTAVVHAYETWTVLEYGAKLPTFEKARLRSMFLVANEMKEALAS